MQLNNLLFRLDKHLVRFRSYFPQFLEILDIPFLNIDFPSNKDYVLLIKKFKDGGL